MQASEAALEAIGLASDKVACAGVIIRRLVAVMAQMLDFDPLLTMEGPLDSAAPDVLHADLLAVISEALTNVARHARAQLARVRVSVNTAVRTVTVMIEDHGKGLDLSTFQEAGWRTCRRSGRSAWEGPSRSGTAEWAEPGSPGRCPLVPADRQAGCDGLTRQMMPSAARTWDVRLWFAAPTGARLAA